MDLITKPNNKITDWFLAIYHNSNEDFNLHINNRNSYKILLVKEGTGILNINGVRKSFFSSTLMIFNERDTVVAEDVSNLNASAIYFHPMAINSKINFENIITRNGSLTQTDIQDIAMFTNFIDKSDSIEIGPRTAKNINNIFINIKNELKFQGDGYWPCRARSYLIELLILIQRIFSSERIIDKDLTHIKSDDSNETLLYIYNNIQNRITIQDISKSLGINRNLVQKYIYEATSLPAMTYLSKLRIQSASLILKDTNIPINEVAERCGFNDITNFGRAFKKATGVTPSEYRNISSL